MDLLLAALLIGVGLWLVTRARFFVAALTAHYPALRSERTAALLAVTLLAVGIGTAGLGCQILFDLSVTS